MSCELCGKEQFVLLFKGNMGDVDEDRFAQYSNYNDILQCEGCGLVVQKPLDDKAAVFTKIRDEKYLDEKLGSLNLQEKHIHFEMLVQTIREFSSLEGAAVLDVGANTGVFLRLLQRYGCKLYGLEPSVEAAEFASKTPGIVMQNAVLEDAVLPEQHFDIITMWDVIEHLYHPRADLARLFSKLKPGGKIFITTHDVGDWFAKVMGRHYPMLMYQHFFHFSKRTMSLMLQQTGFEIVGLNAHFKSWSVGYLHELLHKLWPRSKFSSLLRRGTAPIVKIDWVSRQRITVPIRNFFVIVAQRPKLDRA